MPGATRYQEGIGLYRGPGNLPDDLSPGPPPADAGVPVTGNEPGPPIALPLEAWEKHLELIDKLGRFLSVRKPNDPSGLIAGATDGSGNAVIPCYQVAAGDELRPSRIVVEASGYTPSAPYTGVGYCAIYELEDVGALTVAQATVFGGLRDVAAGSATQAFLPAIFEYGNHQSPRIRGPNWLAVVISAGPASKQIAGAWQGALGRMTGIA